MKKIKTRKAAWINFTKIIVNGKKDTNEYIPYDCTYIKFKDRQS